MRNPKIDVFRGLNMLEMQTTEFCDLPFFNHASYDDKTLNYADTIFPTFSFITGLTLSPDRIIPIKKSLQVVGLGMGFNSMPVIIEKTKFRPLGVLQRHGLSAILLNNITPLKLRNSKWYPVVISSLWLLISIGFADNKNHPFEEMHKTAQQKIDLPIFGDRTYLPDFDPEGLLGTLMSSVTIWSGFWLAQHLSELTNLQSFVVGSILMLSGVLLSRLAPRFFPICKPLWTPSFTMITSGWSTVKYSVLNASIPYLPNFLLNALSTFGNCSLEVYFLGELLLLISKYDNHGKSISFWNWTKSKLNILLPNILSETLLTVSVDGLLIGFAYFCTKFGLKIRLF